jgi:hypothetical protein
VHEDGNQSDDDIHGNNVKAYGDDDHHSFFTDQAVM